MCLWRPNVSFATLSAKNPAQVTLSKWHLLCPLFVLGTAFSGVQNKCFLAVILCNVVQNGGGGKINHMDLQCPCLTPKQASHHFLLLSRNSAEEHGRIAKQGIQKNTNVKHRPANAFLPDVPVQCRLWENTVSEVSRLLKNTLDWFLLHFLHGIAKRLQVVLSPNSSHDFPEVEVNQRIMPECAFSERNQLKISARRTSGII